MGIAFGKINVETPAHIVVYKTDNYQIWRYPSCVAAVVRAQDLQLPETATENEFTSAAFRALARYIGVFGNPENRAAGQGEKIAMTAPVEMKGEKVAMTAPVEMKGEKVAMTAPVEMKGGKEAMTAPVTMKTVQMAFFLPATFKTVAEAPVPTNPAVKLEMKEGGRYVGVVQYTGNVNMYTAEEKAATLMEQLKNDGVEITGDWSVCGYNPPFTLPWLKRNEVQVPVDGSRFDHVTESVE